jgi:hypothetical protein
MDLILDESTAQEAGKIAIHSGSTTNIDSIWIMTLVVAFLPLKKKPPIKTSVKK